MKHFVNKISGDDDGATDKQAEEWSKSADLGLQYNCTALYLRVSTQNHAEEGFSLEAQQERLQAYCTAQGWHINPDHITLTPASLARRQTAHNSKPYCELLKMAKYNGLLP